MQKLNDETKQILTEIETKPEFATLLKRLNASLTHDNPGVILLQSPKYTDILDAYSDFKQCFEAITTLTHECYPFSAEITFINPGHSFEIAFTDNAELAFSNL